MTTSKRMQDVLENFCWKTAIYGVFASSSNNCDGYLNHFETMIIFPLITEIESELTCV